MSMSAAATPTVGEGDTIPQVKHTVQFPEPLWDDFGRRCRRRGFSKAQGLRRAVWWFLQVTDTDVARIVLHRADGTEQTIVVSPY
jgi:hypothetical protein